MNTPKWVLGRSPSTFDSKVLSEHLGRRRAKWKSKTGDHDIDRLVESTVSIWSQMERRSLSFAYSQNYTVTVTLWQCYCPMKIKFASIHHWDGVNGVKTTNLAVPQTSNASRVTFFRTNSVEHLNLEELKFSGGRWIASNCARRIKKRDPNSKIQTLDSEERSRKCRKKSNHLEIDWEVDWRPFLARC